MLNDWQRGKIPYFVKPAGDDVSRFILTIRCTCLFEKNAHKTINVKRYDTLQFQLCLIKWSKCCSQLFDKNEQELDKNESTVETEEVENEVPAEVDATELKKVEEGRKLKVKQDYRKIQVGFTDLVI